MQGMRAYKASVGKPPAPGRPERGPGADAETHWSIYEVSDYLGCGSYGSRVVPGGRVHFMIAKKSSDVKVKRVSRLTESKARCCISHDFGGFYQIIPCIRPAVVRIKVAHGYPATIRIFILGRAVQAWQREPGGRPMPPAMEAKGARSTIRERGSRGQSLSPLRLSSEWVGWGWFGGGSGGKGDESPFPPARLWSHVRQVEDGPIHCPRPGTLAPASLRFVLFRLRACSAL